MFQFVSFEALTVVTAYKCAKFKLGLSKVTDFAI